MYVYLARIAALDAGVAQEAPALTLNRLCGSGLQAIVSAANWSVTISHLGGRPAPRDLVERGARVVILDRDNAGELSGALGSGADVLIDTTAYDRDHGSQLIAVHGCIGSFVVVSSACVYRDRGIIP